MSGVRKCTPTSAPRHNYGRVSPLDDAVSVFGNAKVTLENSVQGSKLLEGEQGLNIERLTCISQDIANEKKGRRADQLNSRLGVSTSIVKSEDMDHLTKLSLGFPAEASKLGSGGDATKSQRATIIVDNRKHVSEACRQSLDKFRFRPRTVSGIPVVNAGSNGRDIYPLVGDDIKAGAFSGTRPGAQESLFGSFANYLPDEKEDIFMEGDPNFSEYGSDGDWCWPFPVSDVGQRLSQHVQQCGAVSKTGTSLENSSYLMENSELVENDDYGDIGDDEMMMAVHNLEGYDTWGEGNVIPLVCDIRPGSADELPSIEDVGRYHLDVNEQGGTLREQLYHVYSPPNSPHKFLSREQLASVTGTEMQTSNPHSLPKTLTGQRYGDGLLATEKNFSQPPSVEFALNNYSQEQEVFDCNLQGSPLQETEMESHSVGIEVAITEGYDQTELGEQEASNDIQEWRPDPKETPCVTEESAEEEEGVGEGSMVELKKIRQKFRAKKRVARTEWDKWPSKKRKIRTCDPSQLKISDYVSPCRNTPSPLPTVSSSKRYDRDGKMKPFVRPKFLSVVTKKSSVAGLDSRLSVKTCFRVGEALRVGWMFASGHFTGDALVELYGTYCPSCGEASRRVC